MHRLKEAWTSQTAFMLAAIGAAVGLGNIWRFPYVASSNGGLWFLVPYVICVLLIGIPLFMLEAGQGFSRAEGFIRTIENTTRFRFIGRPFRKFLGMFPIMVNTMILSYYTVLCGWTLWFVMTFLTGGNASFAAMQEGYATVFTFIAVFAAAGVIVIKGIRRGVEPVANYMVPMLFVFMVALFIYAMTLPGALTQVQRSLGDVQAVFSAKTWYYAMSQVMFSLSVGYGIMFTWAMYLRKGKSIKRSAFLVALGDTSVAVLVFLSLIVITGIIGAPISGFALSFEALPEFFIGQGLMGMIVGSAFFLLLFIAAFTSVIAMMEHTRISTGFLKDRDKFILWFTVCAIGLFAAFSYTPLGVTLAGKPLLDTIDFAFGTFLAPFSALVVVFACAYLLPVREMSRKIGVSLKYENLFVFVVRRVIPLATAFLILFSQFSGLY